MIKSEICEMPGIKYPVFQGGMADGRGVAAAWMLGAQGVQMGTRFFSATECTFHPIYKEAGGRPHYIHNKKSERSAGTSSDFLYYATWRVAFTFFSDAPPIDRNSRGLP